MTSEDARELTDAIHSLTIEIRRLRETMVATRDRSAGTAGAISGYPGAEPESVEQTREWPAITDAVAEAALPED